jgi:hypothetical protein
MPNAPNVSSTAIMQTHVSTYLSIVATDRAAVSLVGVLMVSMKAATTAGEAGSGR